MTLIVAFLLALPVRAQRYELSGGKLVTENGAAVTTTATPGYGSCYNGTTATTGSVAVPAPSAGTIDLTPIGYAIST